MMLIGILVVLTFSVRLMLFWALTELREPMVEAGPWMHRCSTSMLTAAALLAADAMLSFATHREHDVPEPLLWQIDHVVMPLVSAILMLWAATCALTHTHQKRRRSKE